MAANALREKLEQHLTIVTPAVNDNGADSTDDVAVSYVPSFEITFAEAQQRLAMLQKFVKEIMIPGQDYGMIPKCDKPSLFKPGAEKLCDIFGFSKRAEITNRTEDWSTGLFHYEVRVTLISKRTGLIEAEGVGCCNTRERKYASQDPFSISNTILKMAKKRAFVDAVLSATRSSGLFSQDLEDLEDVEKATLATPVDSVTVTTSIDVRPVTQNQLNKIQALVANGAIPVNRVKDDMLKRYQVTESRRLTLRQADDFIKFLMMYKAS